MCRMNLGDALHRFHKLVSGNFACLNFWSLTLVKVTAFDGLPPFEERHTLDEILADLEVVTAGEHCLIRKNGFLALGSLKTGAVNWCVARNAPTVKSDPTQDVFASLMFWGAKLWIGLKDQLWQRSSTTNQRALN